MSRLSSQILRSFTHLKNVFGVCADVPYCDAFPEAQAGWLDKLQEDMKAPDVLGYHPPPAHLMRPVATAESAGGAQETMSSEQAASKEKDKDDV